MTVTIHHGDNLEVARTLPDGAFTLVYLDPPFNTGRTRTRAVETARPVAASDAAARPTPSPRESIRRTRPWGKPADSALRRILGEAEATRSATPTLAS